jgi:prolyl-tRNA synthetase
LQGVCVRLELGPRDLAAGTTLAVRRDTGAKFPLNLADLSTTIPALLTEIQADMLAKAQKIQGEHLKIVYEWKDFVPALNANCMLVIPWCEEMECEEAIKDRSAREFV